MKYQISWEEEIIVCRKFIATVERETFPNAKDTEQIVQDDEFNEIEMVSEYDSDESVFMRSLSAKTI